MFLRIWGENVVDPFDFAQDRFLVIFGGFSLFFSVFVENCRCFAYFNEENLLFRLSFLY